MKAMLMLAGILMSLPIVADSNLITVRASASGRTWQVAYEPDEPVVWSWPDGSTTATLCVTSYTERVKAYVYNVTRTDEDETGSWTLPADDVSGGERLFDIGLGIYDGTTLVESMFARVAVLPSAISVVPTNSTTWTRLTTERIVAYDADWSTNTQDATSATLGLSSGPNVVEVALNGVSGYEPLLVGKRIGGQSGTITASLAFDCAVAPCVANLIWLAPGLTVMLY